MCVLGVFIPSGGEGKAAGCVPERISARRMLGSSTISSIGLSLTKICFEITRYAGNCARSNTILRERRLIGLALLTWSEL
jgi:hypothetical protein